MRPPIVVLSDAEPLVFESIAGAEFYLEPEDVRNGEYVAYDSSGQQLSMEVVSVVRRGFFGRGTVRIEATKLVPGHGDRNSELLREYLLKFLRIHSPEDGMANGDLDLDRLIRTFVERWGFTA